MSKLTRFIAVLAAAGSLTAGLAATAAAQPHAVVGYAGTGTIEVGTSGKWCLGVKGTRNSQPRAGLLVYVAACGAAGYEQEWSITQISRPANNDLVGEISPINNLTVCLGISGTTSNVALEGCSDTNAHGFPLRFVPIGRAQGYLDLWVVQRIDKTLISTKTPIVPGRFMQWFSPNSKLAQVLQLPPLSEVQEV